MNEVNGRPRLLGVLIDADNASPAVARELLVEVHKRGVASVKRIYGDWTSPRLNGWKKILIELAIQPVQQFAYTSGKNSTDSAMIIDAMDLLYTATLDGFCLVSSDSDFTGLAMRLRAAGKYVAGFGRTTTPKAFVVACDEFIHTENLRKRGLPPQAAPPHKNRARSKLPAVSDAVASIIADESDGEGWLTLGNLYNLLKRNFPDFDPRTFGHRKFNLFVRSLPFVTVAQRPNANGSGFNYVVRLVETESASDPVAAAEVEQPAATDATPQARRARRSKGPAGPSDARPGLHESYAAQLLSRYGLRLPSQDVVEQVFLASQELSAAPRSEFVQRLSIATDGDFEPKEMEAVRDLMWAARLFDQGDDTADGSSTWWVPPRSLQEGIDAIDAAIALRLHKICKAEGLKVSRPAIESLMYTDAGSDRARAILDAARDAVS